MSYELRERPVGMGRVAYNSISPGGNRVQVTYHYRKDNTHGIGRIERSAVGKSSVAFIDFHFITHALPTLVEFDISRTQHLILMKTLVI